MITLIFISVLCWTVGLLTGFAFCKSRSLSAKIDPEIEAMVLRLRALNLQLAEKVAEFSAAYSSAVEINQSLALKITEIALENRELREEKKKNV